MEYLGRYPPQQVHPLLVVHPLGRYTPHPGRYTPTQAGGERVGYLWSMSLSLDTLPPDTLPLDTLSPHPGRYTPTQAGTPPTQAGTPPGQVHLPPAGTPPVGTPPGQVPPGQVHPQQVHPLGRYPSRAGIPPKGTPPLGAVHAGRYGQQAGGMHPTGMQFLLLVMIVALCLCTCLGRIGSAITGASYKETSSTIIYELGAGDKLYAMVEGTGHAMFVPEGQETRNTFNVHLLYKSLL